MNEERIEDENNNNNSNDNPEAHKDSVPVGGARRKVSAASAAASADAESTRAAKGVHQIQPRIRLQVEGCLGNYFFSWFLIYFYVFMCRVHLEVETRTGTSLRWLS